MSTEIEDFMKNTPKYYPQEDVYLNRGYRNVTIFKQIRENYWTHRFVEETGTYDPGEIGHLMAYYDYHKDITTTEWDASQVDWVGTGLDSLSFTAAVVALIVAPEYAVWANTTSAGFGVISGGRSVLNGDYIGGGLSVGSFTKPPFGTFLSGVSVIRDLSAGSYTITYIPPFER